MCRSAASRSQNCEGSVDFSKSWLSMQQVDQRFKQFWRKQILLPLKGPHRRLSLVWGKKWHWVNSHIHEIAVSRTSVSLALLRWRIQLWMETGWKTFAVVLQYCSEAECLCIDLSDRENGEIFHMLYQGQRRINSIRPACLFSCSRPSQCRL